MPLPRRQQADPHVTVLARKYRIDLLIPRSAPPQLVGLLEPDGRLTLRSERRVEALNDTLEPREINVFACTTA